MIRKSGTVCAEIMRKGKAMIQAIVFLPLLGAILAGIISLFGAHARCPSGDTVEHHDDAHGDARLRSP